VFLNGDNTEEEVLTFGEHDISLQQLIFTLNTQMVKGTPRWGQRAFSSIFDFRLSAVIYMISDFVSAEQVEDDWRIDLMVKVNEFIQSHNTLFIPLVWSWASDQNKRLQVPSLSSILGNEKEDLPQIYVFSPMAHETRAYPEALELETMSPELLMLWAKKTTLEIEVAAFIEGLEASEAEGGEEGETSAEKRK